MTAFLAALSRVASSSLIPSTGGPLGPITQDPDAVRTAACKLVASGSVCSTADATPPTVPAVAPGALGVVSLLLWIALGAAVVVGLVVLGRGLMHRRSRTPCTPRSATGPAPSPAEHRARNRCVR